MSPVPVRRRLLGQAVFVAVALLILFLRLLPLAPGRVAWPGPDLILCLTRRHDVAERGSKIAQIRRDGCADRTPASVSSIAVGWCAKSS